MPSTLHGTNIIDFLNVHEEHRYTNLVLGIGETEVVLQACHSCIAWK